MSLFSFSIKDRIPDKIMGDNNCQAKMYLAKLDDGRQISFIQIDKNFNWTKMVKPMLPNNPDWCPATHFGYLESGEMAIQMQDGTTKTIFAGEAYLIPAGHLPIFVKDCLMIEFSHDTTYTNKQFLNN